MAKEIKFPFDERQYTHQISRYDNGLICIKIFDEDGKFYCTPSVDPFNNEYFGLQNLLKGKQSIFKADDYQDKVFVDSLFFVEDQIHSNARLRILVEANIVKRPFEIIQWSHKFKGSVIRVILPVCELKDK